MVRILFLLLFLFGGIHLYLYLTTGEFEPCRAVMRRAMMDKESSLDDMTKFANKSPLECYPQAVLGGLYRDISALSTPSSPYVHADNIECSWTGLLGVANGPEAKYFRGPAAGPISNLRCVVRGKEGGVQIGLASNQVVDGLVPSNQFGTLRFYKESIGTRMEIERDKVEAFTKYVTSWSR